MSSSSSLPLAGGGSLADQAVNAALSYRAQQPLVDALLQEIGLKGNSLSGLTLGLQGNDKDDGKST